MIYLFVVLGFIAYGVFTGMAPPQIATPLIIGVVVAFLFGNK